MKITKHKHGYMLEVLKTEQESFNYTENYSFSELDEVIEFIKSYYDGK